MANFSYTVDTREMASSIDGVSHHVNGVTTAVAGMQVAVIAAEEHAARRVCQHVDQGFFSLIRSQIMQKIARLRAETDSRLMELRQQSQALGTIKKRMERDYQMISSRYYRVFQLINQSLRTRVFELDRAASNLVHHDLEQLSNRSRGLQAQVPIHQLEGAAAAQSIAAAQAKRNAARAIEAMHGFIADAATQRRLLGSVLAQRTIGEGPRSIPIAFFEADGLSVAAPQHSIRCPELQGATALRERVEQSAMSTLPELAWQPINSAERARIKAEFATLLGKAEAQPRVKTEMQRLFESGIWATIGGLS